MNSKYFVLLVILFTIIIGIPDVDAKAVVEQEHHCLMENMKLFSWMCPHPPKEPRISAHEAWRNEHCGEDDFGNEWCNEDDPYD